MIGNVLVSCLRFREEREDLWYKGEDALPKGGGAVEKHLLYSGVEILLFKHIVIQYNPAIARADVAVNLSCCHNPRTLGSLCIP